MPMLVLIFVADVTLRSRCGHDGRTARTHSPQCCCRTPGKHVQTLLGKISKNEMNVIKNYNIFDFRLIKSNWSCDTQPKNISQTNFAYDI